MRLQSERGWKPESGGMKNSRKKEALVFLLAVRIERKDNDKTKAMPSILGKIDIYKVNIENGRW